MCTRYGGKPHSSRTWPTLIKVCNTCERGWDLSKMCKSKPQPISVKYNKQNPFCEEGNNTSEQASPASEMGMFYTKEQIFSMSATYENISINNCELKMQVDKGADSTVILSKRWTELGKPELYGKIRHLEAYDGYQLTLLGSLTCDVEFNGSRLAQKQLVVVQSGKEFGLLGRDFLLSPCVKKLMWSWYQDHSQCSAKPKYTSTSSRQGHREAGTDGQTGHLWTGTARRSH